MKVKANITELQFYRKKAFMIDDKEMDTKDYRNLFKGDTVDVDDRVVKKYPNIFGVVPKKIEKVYNGN